MNNDKIFKFNNNYSKNINIDRYRLCTGIFLAEYIYILYCENCVDFSGRSVAFNESIATGCLLKPLR